MNTKTLLNRALIVALLFFVATIASAQTPSIFDIEFPIAELGNCPDKTACKTYCNEPANEDACDVFAAKYGIGGHDSGEDDKLAAIEADGGPDGVCGNAPDPVAACGAFCNDQANMETCIAYGEKHNLFPKEELAEARKVRDALRSGAKLPDGCTNAELCKQTCENPPTIEIAKQCFRFAEKAGLLPDDVDIAMAEKAFEAIRSGKTPFKSLKDFQKCDDPADEATIQACVNFGLENGLIPEKEAEILRKTGGRGPGGCFGKTCETYCDDPAHEDECIRFAEEYDLIPPEEKAQMQEGIQKFQEGLNQAPPEVRECLKATVGSEVLDQIAAGTKRPSRDLGEKMRTCFESFFMERDAAREQTMGPAFPPEVKQCLVERLGPDFMERMKNGPTPELENEMRPCFERQTQGGPGEPGMMPSQDPRILPSQPMPFPGKSPVNCGSPEECQKLFGEMGPQGSMPGFPGGFPSDMNEGTAPDSDFHQEFQKQYEEQYNQEFQEQFNNQLPGGMMPGGQPPFPAGAPEYPPAPNSYPPASGSDMQSYPPPQDFGGYPPANAPMPGSGDMPAPYEPQSGFNPPSFLGFFLHLLGVN